MAKAILINTSNNKVTKISLPKDIFVAKINSALMAQAVKVFLSNQRQAPAKTLRRGEIKASGRKIYRQKGTGGARHGDRKAPIFVKGAKAHGPTGEQNYKLKMSKKMKRLALFSALSSKLKKNEIAAVNGLEKIQPKTKNVAKVIKKIEALFEKAKTRKKTKITFILPAVLNNIIRAGNNIDNLNFLQAKQLNTYEVLNGGKLVFMKESLKVLEETFLKKGKKASKKQSNKKALD